MADRDIVDSPDGVIVDRRRACECAVDPIVADAAIPAVTVPADLPVPSVELLFRREPDLRGLVVRGKDGDVHLLARTHLDALLAGRFGYGRALTSRQTVLEVVPESTLLVPAAMTLRAAAEAVLLREPSVRYDDLVVDGHGQGFGLLPVTVLFENLSRTFSALALRDGLTGLPNRSSLEQRIADVPLRPGTALLYVDLDGFKSVNDTHGHRAGDELLCAFAERLRECVRPGDLVVRLGGDEFAVLLEEVTPAEARGIADRVVAGAALPFPVASSTVCVGASVGIALHDAVSVPAERIDVDVLLRSADAAMYQAKREGKGRRVSRSVLVDASAGVPTDLRSRLQSALQQGRIQPHFQPKVDLRSGVTCGFEALARWTEPDLGAVPPDRFVVLAETAGMVDVLGAGIMDGACQAARTWVGAGRDWDVAVNLSPVQLARPEALLEMVRAVLDRHELDPDRLWLELTETAALSDLREGVAALHELRRWGVRVALDDFGTGYSSLGRLRDLPLDAVKIDRSFVERIGDPAGERMVRMVVDIARDIGLLTVAEGVETHAQLQALRDLGCEQAQGFLLGRPAVEAAPAPVPLALSVQAATLLRVM